MKVQAEEHWKHSSEFENRKVFRVQLLGGRFFASSGESRIKDVFSTFASGPATCHGGPRKGEHTLLEKTQSIFT